MADTPPAPPPEQPPTVTPPSEAPPAPPDWRAEWPDELKADETLGRFSSSSDLAKSYLEVRTKVGADTLAIPGKEATDEQRSEFWEKLGVPKSADDYKVPSELPEGVTLSEDDVKAVWPKFHELNLSEQQAAGVLRLYAERELADAQGLSEQVKTDREEALGTLKKEWGSAYDERITLAQSAVEALGIRQYANEQGFGDDPTMLKAFAEVGKWLAEDQVRGRGQRTFQPSVEEAKIKIDEIRADTAKMKAYNDPSDPASKGVRDELERLNKVAYPGQHEVGPSTVSIGAA